LTHQFNSYVICVVYIKHATLPALLQPSVGSHFHILNDILLSVIVVLVIPITGLNVRHQITIRVQEQNPGDVMSVWTERLVVGSLGLLQVDHDEVLAEVEYGVAAGEPVLLVLARVAGHFVNDHHDGLVFRAGFTQCVFQGVPIELWSPTWEYNVYLFIHCRYLFVCLYKSIQYDVILDR
jgi:hypothetical protein